MCGNCNNQEIINRKLAKIHNNINKKPDIILSVGVPWRGFVHMHL